MGDADIKIENQIIDERDSLNVDVLRIGHHGSKTSTCEEFVKFTSPKLAIISVGKNYYGHPNKEVISILTNNNICYYRTDCSYNICLTSKNIIENY